jgi:hypothetical protein
MLKTVRGAVNINYWWIPDGKTLMGATVVSIMYPPIVNVNRTCQF